MDTLVKYKALCYVEQNFAQKHDVFFSLTAGKNIGEFLAIPFDFSHDIFICDTLASTLDFCHTHTEQGKLDDFSSVICKVQTQGRGQLRREWKSLSDNLYSALILPHCYPFNTDAAAPAVGLLFAQALENMGFSVALKWPNDLVQKQVYGNKVRYEKIGGILLEERNGHLIAGVGINLCSCPEDTDLRKNFFISAGRLNCFQDYDRKKIFLNNFYNSLAYRSGHSAVDYSQHIEKICDIDNFYVILGFWFTLVKEIKLCYEKKILFYNNHTWNMLYKKYLAFLGDTVCINDALTKQDFSDLEYSSEKLSGQIVGLGQEGELLLSSQNGLMCIVGGSITNV